MRDKARRKRAKQHKNRVANNSKTQMVATMGTITHQASALEEAQLVLAQKRSKLKEAGNRAMQAAKAVQLLLQAADEGRQQTVITVDEAEQLSRQQTLVATLPLNEKKSVVGPMPSTNLPASKGLLTTPENSLPNT